MEPEILEIDDAVVEQIPHPRRPMAPFMWYGGKGNLASWVVKHLPVDGVKVYVEPYAGAASVFWHLPKPFPVEVLNDLDKRIVTLFRVLQDKEKFQELRHRLIWTPYAREEYRRALRVMREWDEHDDIDRAWAFFVSQNQGYSGLASCDGNWSRTFVSGRGMAVTAAKWRARQKLLVYWNDRLTRVQIDCRDALEVIRYWDSPETLFYIDPPYVPSTRVNRKVYKYDLSDDHHERLVDVLLNIQGQAALSGYDNPIYSRLESAGWEKHEKLTCCFAAARNRGTKLRGEGSVKTHAPRVEVLWVKMHKTGLLS